MKGVAIYNNVAHVSDDEFVGVGAKYLLHKTSKGCRCVC